ncbi:hypothetical protein CEXT_787691 [Caerostris extrusa]|uniref:Uncharacterized protein n=1 Tax=Caerostris extrusa TaxID=172846 RepID=A0AAV4NT77_CAEEX|nr:hypothetical protein CEXT_787691 [Caerostris extrusa]
MQHSVHRWSQKQMRKSVSPCWVPGPNICGFEKCDSNKSQTSDLFPGTMVNAHGGTWCFFPIAFVGVWLILQFLLHGKFSLQFRYVILDYSNLLF